MRSDLNDPTHEGDAVLVWIVLALLLGLGICFLVIVLLIIGLASL